jgi:hypothetical protein
MTQRVIDKRAFFEKIGYTPHEKQGLYHASKARFRYPNCGRRFGKSTMAGRDMEPKLFLPEKTYWIVGPTYDLGEKEFRVIWQDLIVKQRMGRDKTIKKAYNKKQGNMFIQFPWTTRLEVRSADHPENLVGEALDWVIMSEAAKHRQDTWEKYIRPALADRRGGADFPTTPEGYNWLYDEWMHGQDKEFPDYESWRFPAWDNSAVYPGSINDPEIKLLRRTMSQEAFMQEIGAEFGSFVGKIYGEWDPSAHVDNIQFNPAWPNYMAIDFGYVDASAWIEFQVSPQDEIFVWREHYQSFMTIDEHISFIKRRENPPGYHLDLAFADAADPEGIAKVATGLVQCVGDPMAKQNWREGVELIKGFLEREIGEDEYGGPIYAPAFFVDFSCENTIWEFNNYRTPSSAKGVPIKPANSTKAPAGMKQRDHALDALRYGAMHKFVLGATYHLADVAVMNLPTVGQIAEARAVASTAAEFALTGTESGFFTTFGEF